MRYVRDGNQPRVAASLVGISQSTYFSWMERGRKGEAQFSEFSESIERAQAGAIVDRVARIYRAAVDGNWRAAAWLLERIAPEMYGKRSRGVMERGARRQGQPTQASIARLEELVLQLQLRRQKYTQGTTLKIEENQ